MPDFAIHFTLSEEEAKDVKASFDNKASTALSKLTPARSTLTRVESGVFGNQQDVTFVMPEVWERLLEVCIEFAESINQKWRDLFNVKMRQKLPKQDDLERRNAEEKTEVSVPKQTLNLKITAPKLKKGGSLVEHLVNWQFWFKLVKAKEEEEEAYWVDSLSENEDILNRYTVRRSMRGSQTFKQVLRASVIDVDNLDENDQKIDKERLRQRRNETVEDFLKRFRICITGFVLVTDTTLTDEEITELLFIKLRDYETLSLILPKESQKDQEILLKAAKKLEKNGKKPTINLMTAREEEEVALHMIGPKPKPKLGPKRPPKKFAGECFGCLKPGHRIIDCPVVSKKNSKQVVVEVVERPNKEEHSDYALVGNLPLLEIKVEDTKCQALWDSGSQISLVSQGLMDNLSEEVKVAELPVYFEGVGSSGQVDQFAVLEVELPESGEVWQVPAFVTEKLDSKPFSLLVGNNSKRLRRRQKRRQLDKVDMMLIQEEWKTNHENTKTLEEKEDSRVKEEVKRKLESLLKKYDNSFHDEKKDWKFSKLEPIELELTDPKAFPPKHGQRTFKKEDREEIESDIQDLLSKGIIAPSTTRFRSPLMVARPAQHRVRVCTYLRKINKLLKDVDYPMPTIDEILRKMSGSQYFSRLALKSGYHQIPLAKKSSELLGIIFEDQVFEFRSLPFGVKTAAAEFQRRLDDLFNEKLGVCVLIYIDDIVVYTKDECSHLAALEWVFQKISEAGLQVSRGKSEFLKREIDILGFRVSDEGIKVTKERIEAIIKSGEPKPRRTQKLYRDDSAYPKVYPRSVSVISTANKRYERPEECQIGSAYSVGAGSKASL